MADSEKPWTAEYAKSSKSACKGCGNKIGKDELRLGMMVQASNFDGRIPLWHHSNCFFSKPNRINTIDDIDHFDSLRWDDQELIRNYVKGKANAADGTAEASEASGASYAIENAKSGRASCKVCGDKIAKGTVRVSSGKSRTVAWKHVGCFLDAENFNHDIEDISGWDELSEEDQKMVRDLVKPGKGLKRKPDAIADNDQNTKQKKQAVESPEEAEKRELDKKLEKQAKALWSVMDDLKNNLSNVEMKEFIVINGGGTPPTAENDLRERCADIMMFGPLQRCPHCNGPVVFSDGMYKCRGHLSAWSACTYSTPTANREEKWEVPDDCDNKFLLKSYKQQKVPKPDRVLRPQERKESGKDGLKDLKVVLVGDLIEKTQSEWKAAIAEAGGTISSSCSRGTVIVTTKAEAEKENPFIMQGRGMRLPIVEEQYLLDCLKNGSKLPLTKYLIESTKNSGVTKVKVKGRSAVHEDSGLQDKGHILEVDNDIYNVTLNMSDLTKGRNSYYVLQVIAEDNRNAYHVFRRWGRVGDATHGGKTINEFTSKTSAIASFCNLFEEKTGNSWESKGRWVKMPGKFYPLEIDYGTGSEEPQKLLAGTRSKLHPRLLSLMKMLFDIETYKAAMVEFEINTDEMPLGKLTKRHVENGFNVLKELQDLIRSEHEEITRRNLRILDASNRFNTLIPSANPTVIDDEDCLKKKIQMLEALRDIEIASQLINAGEQEDEEDPIDSKYKKLNCAIEPLPHDSSEFKLVKKYLEITHAPTHTEWALELEDVFVVNRGGERDKYIPMKSSMDNHMLLWHGSRTTNFVGILSQGLRIAPPEAPATGYMFGKGVYFADLVSKSAQYCFTSRSNPMGLMLLSEVALGRMKELRHAQYMEKPPSGFSSTKGLGKMMPDPSTFETMEDDVVVPCGKPVPSRVSSDLQYNEYIVYSTAQVNLRYLLKVQFKYKR